MANRNFPNSRLYSGHYAPVMIDCQFTVSSTDSGGLGITSLKGPYVANVFMNTSATPASGNPNPSAGIIVVQLQDNFNRWLTGFKSISSPNSGSNVAVSGSSLSVGAAYVISVLGTSTAADWIALGVPKGVTPAVGVSFIAAATGAGSGSGQVQLPATNGSTVMQIEQVGDPNQSIAPSPSANQGFGGQFIFRCMNKSGAQAAPADGSVITIGLILSNSSLTVGGE